MYHGDLIDSDETGSDSSEPSLPAKRRKAKGNKNSNKSGNQLTWAEAAEIVSGYFYNDFIMFLIEPFDHCVLNS